MTVMAAVALGGLFTGCSKDADINGGNDSAEFNIVQNYENAFITRFGQPHENQTWGFGESVATTRGTRSQNSPSCPHITQPYDEAWVTEYLTTAKEPDSQNIGDNYDNTTYATNWTVLNAIPWDGSDEDMLRRWFTNNGTNNGMTWEETIAWALANRPNWLTYNQDETYVRNFKITGTYDGLIIVAGSEGITDGGTLSHSERTIVVTGIWNITEDQRIGSLGKIIIANGGKVNVASGKTLNMVNQAQLVVLPGGTLTGEGKVEVNNGNESGRENYNGGTVSVATFNNNFGKFYNYGDFLVDEYQGGAKESNFYNHHLVKIGHFAGTGSTANARIFNECQFYVINNARIRNYEGVGGSALIVGGELMFSSSEDGTSTPTYVGLADGALVKCNTLYNNGTSWTGPTSGYAALEIDSQIDYLNWQQDAPETGGYFENNIYVKCGTWDNVPDGNGYHQTDASDTYNHSLSIADYKFWNTVANCRGNGGVKKVEDGNNELLPASEDFVLGSAGCTPGFKGKEDPPYNPPTNPDIICRIIVEDLTVGENSDFDFNDVVFDVCKNGKLIIRAIGGELPIYIGTENANEVHAVCSITLGDTDRGRNSYMFMRNTGWTYSGGKASANIDYNAELGTIKLDGTFNTPADAQKIDIWVHKNGRNYKLEAPKGKVASMVCVGTDFEWCSERQDIDKKFRKKDGTKLFQQYVRGVSPYDNDDWTSERKTWYQYRGE